MMTDWYDAITNSNMKVNLMAAPYATQEASLPGSSSRDKTSTCIEFPQHESVDCTFVVGNQRQNIQEFKCSSVLLTQASPVLDVMLNGSFKESWTRIVHVPDITPEAFVALLQYVYKGAVCLESFELAFAVLYAAKKYMMFELLAECRAYLWSRLFPSNVWRALDLADVHDEERLLDTAWQLVHMHTSELLGAADFTNISYELMIALFCEERLSCSELELFTASVRWAQASPSRNLAPLLEHIRILAMPHTDFVRGPVISQALTRQQKLELCLFKIDARKDNCLTKRICDIQESRLHHNYDTFFVFGTTPESLNTDLYKFKTTYYIFSSFSFNSYTNTTLVVPTQISNKVHDKYEEDLTVLLYRCSDFKLVSSRRIRKNVLYNSTIDLLYRQGSDGFDQDSVAMYCQVIFHKSGYYPLHLTPPIREEIATTTTFSFNGRENTYFSFEKKFTFTHFLFHHLYCITVSSWSKIIDYSLGFQKKINQSLLLFK